MNKEQGINWIKEIQNGKFNRDDMKNEIPLGRIAEKLWDDTTFGYGMEYGIITAIIKVFNIKNFT